MSLMLPGRPLWQWRRLLVDGVMSGVWPGLGLDVLADGQGLVPGAREDGSQGLVHILLLALGGGHPEGERPGLGGVGGGGGGGDRVDQHAPRLGPLDGDAPVGGAGQELGRPHHSCKRARVPGVGAGVILAPLGRKQSVLIVSSNLQFIKQDLGRASSSLSS